MLLICPTRRGLELLAGGNFVALLPHHGKQLVVRVLDRAILRAVGGARKHAVDAVVHDVRDLRGHMRPEVVPHEGPGAIPKLREDLLLEEQQAEVLARSAAVL
jgi:hypothetical protein